MRTLIVDDVRLQVTTDKWFVWVKDDVNEDFIDWSAYVSSVPEGVMKASQAGYPVTHWMRLSNKISMSAEAIKGSQQQLSKQITLK